MKRMVSAFAILAVMVVAMPGASAATSKRVGMKDNVFTNTPILVGLNNGPLKVTFKNNGDNRHDATQNNPLRKWRTGNLDPGESKVITLKWAGTFPYRCVRHTGMNGEIQLAGNWEPWGGGYKVWAATVSAPNGFVYDIQKSKNSGPFKNWKMRITASKVSFNPNTSAHWQFRSRIRRLSNNGASGWSPEFSIYT